MLPKIPAAENKNSTNNEIYNHGNETTPSTGNQGSQNIDVLENFKMKCFK